MIEKLKRRVREGNYRFTVHGLERCIERDISPNEVNHAIVSGDIIEDYPKDRYGPSCLICGAEKGGRTLHVQCSIDPIWVITAYDPSLEPDKWTFDFKRRIKKS